MFKILTCILYFAQTVFASCFKDVKNDFDTIWPTIDGYLRNGVPPIDVSIHVFKDGDSLYSGQLLYAALYNFIQSRSTIYSYISCCEFECCAGGNLMLCDSYVQKGIQRKLRDKDSGLSNGAKSLLTASLSCIAKISGNTLDLDGEGAVRPEIEVTPLEGGEAFIVREYVDCGNYQECKLLRKPELKDYKREIIQESIELILKIVSDEQNIDALARCLISSIIEVNALEILKKNNLDSEAYAIIPNITTQCQDINNIILEKQILKKIKDDTNIYCDKIQQNYTQELMNMKLEHTTLKLFTNPKNMHIRSADVVDFLGAKFYRIEFSYTVGECFFDALQILRADFWDAIDNLKYTAKNGDMFDFVQQCLSRLDEDKTKVSHYRKPFVWMWSDAYEFCSLASQVPIVVCFVNGEYHSYCRYNALPYRVSYPFAFVEKAPIFISANGIHFQLMIPVNWVKDNSFGYTECSAHYKPVVDQLRKYLNIKTHQSDSVDTDCEDYVCDFESDTEC